MRIEAIVGENVKPLYNPVEEPGVSRGVAHHERGNIALLELVQLDCIDAISNS